jgi:hypothetical protein
MHATIATIARLTAKFDCDFRQTSCPFNQLRLTWGRVPRNTRVHLQSTEIFATLSPDDCGKENMQTKKRSTTQNFSGADFVIERHGDQGNHISYLTIKSVTDIVQNFRHWRSSRNRLKNLLFCVQQILNSVFGIARRHRNLPLRQRAEFRLIHMSFPLFRSCPSSFSILVKLGLRIPRERVKRVSGKKGPWLLGFHGIKSSVRRIQKSSDRVGVLRITGNSYADGKPRIFGVLRKKVANPLRYQCGSSRACFWQN